jgi:hypothetical protein
VVIFKLLWIVGLAVCVALSNAGAAFAAAYAPNQCIELAAPSNALVFRASPNTGARVAFVLGNASYGEAGTLKNPANDAIAVAERLVALGFRTYLMLDADAVATERCLDQLEDPLSFADVGLFYYAGHGAQVGDENFIVAASAGSPLVSVNNVIRRFTSSARASLIFLDACRNNPFGGQGRTGLAVADVRSLQIAGRVEEASIASESEPRGLLITYATSPNSTADDGSGRHSPFTEAFLQAFGSPGVSIQETVTHIGGLVSEATNYEQVPWSRFSLTSTLYLNGQLTREQSIAESNARAMAALALAQKGEQLEARKVVLSAFPRVLPPGGIAEYKTALEALLYLHTTDSIRLDMRRADAASFSPDGKRVAIVKREEDERVTLGLWDRATGAKVADLMQFGSWETGWRLRFSPDSKRVFAQTSSGLFIWGAKDGDDQRTHNSSGKPKRSDFFADGSVEWFDISPDGERVLMQARDGDFLRVVHIETGLPLLRISHDEFGIDRWATSNSRALFAGSYQVALMAPDASCEGVRFLTVEFFHWTRRETAARLSGGADCGNLYPRNFSADGRTALLVHGPSDVDKTTALVFSVPTGELLFSVQDRNAGGWLVTPDGGALFTPRYLDGNSRIIRFASAPMDRGTLTIKESGIVMTMAGEYLAGELYGTSWSSVSEWIWLPETDLLVRHFLSRFDAETEREVIESQLEFVELFRSASP